MKKIFTLGIMALLAAGSATAASVVQVTQGDLWNQTAGMMTLGMSNNGRYLVGSCYSGEGFLYDTETKKIVLTSDFPESKQDETGTNQFWCATDDGTAFGWDGNGGIVMTIDGYYEVFCPISNTYDGVVPYGTTSDGSVVVGYLMKSFYNIVPCYWENGELHTLPFSTAADAGFAINKGAKAQWVSADGSIIVGNIENRSSYNPMCYWVRQNDGTYEYVAAFKDYYEDPYDQFGKLKEAYTTGKNTRFQPFQMSPDGKTIALYVQQPKNYTSGIFELGLYDVPTNTLTIIPYDRNNLLYTDRVEFTVTGISDNGYITGVAGSPTAGAIPFVAAPDDYENAMTFTQAFPDNELLEKWQNQGGGVYISTGISADGSRICGYVETFMEGNDQYVGFAGFYINTGFNGEEPDPGPGDEPEPGPGEEPDSGVSSILDADGSAIYFTPDGLSHDAPVKGLNIVRTPDGKTRKVIVK